MGPHGSVGLLTAADGGLLAFFGVAALVIVTPGPDTALTIRNALLGGWRAGMATAAGVATGQAIWAIGTSFGIVGLLATSEPAFVAVKLLGAGYLVFLGVCSIRAALARSPRPEPFPHRVRRGDLSPSRGFRQGILNDLGNPKMAAFFTSLLPQFVPARDVSFITPMALGLLFCAMTLVWLILYAGAVVRLGALFRRPAIRRGLEGVTGIVLVGLGIRLASEHR
jgi:threonine/homoserine/homoserine lactone efflux protein